MKINFIEDFSKYMRSIARGNMWEIDNNDVPNQQKIIKIFHKKNAIINLCSRETGTITLLAMIYIKPTF